MNEPELPAASPLDRLIRFCLDNTFVVTVILLLIVGWGMLVAPFDWDLGGLVRDPVPVDAIPDIGENQQIVFTSWMGRSPQDVEDQVTYPLTVSLLGVPSVKAVRSSSFFGFSSIYVIFEDGTDFYWARSRVLEKLNSLPAGTLPEGVQPALGPDATALGQVFWYTLEGQDSAGRPTGGWDLDELRSVQDWYVRYALLAADGVAEVASIGGFVREYQIDVDPDAMRVHGIGLNDVFSAVRMSNVDVGARSIEVNRVEYFIRGLGLIRSIEDLEKTVVKVAENVPIMLRDVANVTLGPALRRGALDREGAEAVGGVVVVRYGQNPLAAIKSVKQKIVTIAPGMPEKVVMDFARVTRPEIEAFAQRHGFAAYAGPKLNQDAWIAWMKSHPADTHPVWATLSQVALVPFYDRTGLIYETLGTLNTAISLEIIVTILVVLVMVRHIASSVLISGLLPLAVLMTFIAMKVFGVDANIVALSGIAIAIGTMVDMGVVICENILRHLKEETHASPRESVYHATREVGGAVLTAVATTVVGFLPVFAMEAAEGKLFKPLAYTKTFALIASIIVALTLIPPFARLLFSKRDALSGRRLPGILFGIITAAGMYLAYAVGWGIGLLVVGVGVFKLVEHRLPSHVSARLQQSAVWLLVGVVAILLSRHWLPLGPEVGLPANIVFVAGTVGGVLIAVHVFQRLYPRLLAWALANRKTFLVIPSLTVLLGLTVWLGLEPVLGRLPETVRHWGPVAAVSHAFPGLGKEFMPPLDEGSYLLMPTTMPHASIGEALDVMQKQDMAMQGVPEIDAVVGKLGRVESPLDPAPISMFETVINYKPRFLVDRNGNRLRFRFDAKDTDLFRDVEGNPLPAPDGEPYIVRGRFLRDDDHHLIPDDRGVPFRLWRPALEPALNPERTAWGGIHKPDDIWDAIIAAVAIPGTTSAPRLQPIAARIVMLQSGMRAPMGVKVKGPDLETIERVGIDIERMLKEVPSVEPSTVIADRMVGKPYLEIDIDRDAIARHGLHVRQVQDVIEVAIGGKGITSTIEGRERYSVRVRYLRERRDQIESLDRILVPAPDGAQIPLTQLAEIRYVRGPQVIKSEDTFLLGYVVFDKKPGVAEVDTVEQCQAYLQQKLDSGEFDLPAGVTYAFAGSYENQVRAASRLAVLVPVALLIIFLILYLHFHSAMTSLLVFSGIFVAWAGGFIMIWLYAQDWFLNISLFGVDLRDLFQIHPINLSVAVWVGFLALFGIASDNGVLVATVLRQAFGANPPDSVQAIRERTVEAAMRRIRPALMTTATTILALLPVLTSTGRGADIMIPMAIPTFGGMCVALLTVFVVPVLYCAVEESAYKRRRSTA